MPAGKKPVWPRFDASEPLRAQRVLDRIAGWRAQYPKDGDGWALARRNAVVKLNLIENRKEVPLRVSLPCEQSDPTVTCLGIER